MNACQFTCIALFVLVIAALFFIDWRKKRQLRAAGVSVEPADWMAVAQATGGERVEREQMQQRLPGVEEAGRFGSLQMAAKIMPLPVGTGVIGELDGGPTFAAANLVQVKEDDRVQPFSTFVALHVPSLNPRGRTLVRPEQKVLDRVIPNLASNTGDIDLESVEFNRLFHVSGDDERAAWDLLTPPTMLAMLELEQEWQAALRGERPALAEGREPIGMPVLATMPGWIVLAGTRPGVLLPWSTGQVLRVFDLANDLWPKLPRHVIGRS